MYNCFSGLHLVLLVSILQCVYPSLLPEPQSPTKRLSKRARYPPIPVLKEIMQHLTRPGPNRAVFFTGGTADLAKSYAKTNNRLVIWHKEVDHDGWLQGDSGPFALVKQLRRERKHRETWSVVEESTFNDLCSEAYARSASGDVYIVVPEDYNQEKGKTSIYSRIEEPILLESSAVTSITRVRLQGKPDDFKVIGTQRIYPTPIALSPVETVSSAVR